MSPAPEANIATWIDTLLAALLLDSPRAFTIVLTEMLAGSLVSLTVLFFLFPPYSVAANYSWAEKPAGDAKKAAAAK